MKSEKEKHTKKTNRHRRTKKVTAAQFNSTLFYPTQPDIERYIATQCMLFKDIKTLAAVSKSMNKIFNPHDYCRVEIGRYLKQYKITLKEFFANPTTSEEIVSLYHSLNKAKTPEQERRLLLQYLLLHQNSNNQAKDISTAFVHDKTPLLTCH